MIKIVWSNVYGYGGDLTMDGKNFFASIQDAENYVQEKQPFGKPARWLPDFLEGAETKEVQDTEEIGHTEYLHPAEYTYEIIEESLEVVRARKLAELSSISKSKNPYLKGEDHLYRLLNTWSGKYEKEVKASKGEAYVADYLAVSDSLANEYLRCENLVNNAATEQEILAVTFNL